MGKARDLCYFERGITVNARGPGSSIPEIPKFYGFSRTPVSWILKEWQHSLKIGIEIENLLKEKRKSSQASDAHCVQQFKIYKLQYNATHDHPKEYSYSLQDKWLNVLV